ncbi:MAG: hypothetical protein A4E38_00579 [Methanoregulaceae archaeon PtaB.Bin108]|nr:MAG: hypothetical protein A4E38_00579 [Methanoregulaceae archaeon PtaB.Bin108]
MIASFTPFVSHWRRTSATACAGTAITAASTFPGISPIVGYAFFPRISEARGLTGYTCPGNLIRFLSRTYPIFCGSVDAPMTAIDPG